MEHPVVADQLRTLKLFVDIAEKEPSILHHKDMAFFKKFIESLGGVIPPKRSEEEASDAKEEDKAQVEPESDESDVELDFEGVIEPDLDPPQTMGYTKEKISEEDIVKSDEMKRIAMELFSEQKYEEAINAYTEAILLNPTSALLYAKRGQCFLQLMKPNACIRDCTQALVINPDNAAAYKFRGRAHRLLGEFVQAAEDLRNACKIDYDEQADEWLKEVTPNARKLEEHQRKYERKRLEKEVKKTRERIQRMREEQQKRDAETKESNPTMEEEILRGGMGDFLNIMNDPEIVQAFKDPEVSTAFREITQNPANIFKYQSNVKINALLKKLTPLFMKQLELQKGMSGLGEMGGLGGLGGLGGFPFYPGGKDAGGSQDGSKKPPPSSDLDLD